VRPIATRPPADRKNRHARRSASFAAALTVAVVLGAGTDPALALQETPQTPPAPTVRRGRSAATTAPAAAAPAPAAPAPADAPAPAPAAAPTRRAGRGGRPAPSADAAAPAAPAAAEAAAPAPMPAEDVDTSPPAAPPDLDDPAGYEGRNLERGESPQAGDAEGGVGEAPSGTFLPFPDRWRIGQPEGYAPNVRSPGGFLDPYNQNVFKGDYPIYGQDWFLVVNLVSDTLFEARKLPVPAGISTNAPGRFDFFGGGDQQLLVQNFVVSFELFEGNAAFKPRDLEFRFTPVFNLNFVSIEEVGITRPDVREGDDRFDGHVGIQELLIEKHLVDLTVNYDFITSIAGIQGFTSDFRGHLYSDNNLGLRLTGQYGNNRYQYNLAYFYQLDKDTNSGLNDYDFRDQHVILANLFVQDSLRFLRPRSNDPRLFGLTQGFFFAANFDNAGDDFELDDNGFIVRPAPFGTVGFKDVQAYYLGWGVDGHVGRLNLSTQFYQAFGRESFNQLAEQEVDINAQFFAAEVSYDVDWARYRASFAYLSGDGDPEDGKATGFDTIFDNPNFAGGGFSYFTRQAVRLTGSGVNLVNRNSFAPNLRTSKEEGQANFVNPGLFLYNVGADFDITPKAKLITNASWLQFADTSTLELILGDDKIGRDIGLDLSVGLQYRPFNNQQAIVTVGAAALIPGQGFDDIYASETLYSTFVSLTLAY